MPTVKTSKEEILQKSTLLIWEHGYKNTSFKDLSKACGIRGAHFYYYFKDKEDLMTQVLETSRQYFIQKIFCIAYREDLLPEDRMALIIKKLNVLYLKGAGGCMFGNTALETAHTDSPFLEVVKDFFKEFIAALTHIYGFKLPLEEAEAKAIQTIQQLEGAVMMMRLFKDPNYIHRAWEKIKV